MLTKRFRFVGLAVIVVVAVIGGGIIGNLIPRGLPDLMSVGTTTEQRSTQIIEAVNREQQVVLLSLGIQGVEEQTSSGTVFGYDIPGSSRSAFIIYSFNAKLGIEGADVTVEETDDGTFLITVPEFIFIGHYDESFRLASESSGIMSWVTPEIDAVEMINTILDDEAHAEYIESNRELLEDQTRSFYTGIIHGIDPDISIEFDFAS